MSEIKSNNPKKSNKIITASVGRKIKNTNTRHWIYIVPTDKKWGIRMDGASRALHLYNQKAAALMAARKIAQTSKGSHIIIYDTHGEIQRVIQ